MPVPPLPEIEELPGQPSGSQLALETITPLAQHVDLRRRLEYAGDELLKTLKRLPHTQFRVEPFPLAGDRRNTFLVLGPTGVFVIVGSHSAGAQWEDLVYVHGLGASIQALLPGWRGEVQAAICHESTFYTDPPRRWFRAGEDGVWIGVWRVGDQSLLGWITELESEHPLGAGDLAQFDDLARPRWRGPAVPARRTWPPTVEVSAQG